MNKKIKTVDLENIPLILEKVAGLMDSQIELLAEKTDLTYDDTKAIIAYANALAYIYKEYRVEVHDTEAKLKTSPKEALMKIIKSDAKRA